MTERLPLRALAPAKINLGLFVGPTRSDGRHELVSAMQSISLADELTLERASAGTETDEVLCPGMPALERDNLVARALASFRAASGWSPGALRLTIVKRVPVAAGLGGGSGDAAAALRLVARASGIDDHMLVQRLAADLGADVPAQVEPGRWLALGAGELLTALPPLREPFGVLVLPVAAELSTASVYAEADRLGRPRTRVDLRELARALREVFADGAQLPPESLLVNDLQRAAVSLCPQIQDALAQALACGADVALVSGSGPTVLGLFAGADGPTRAGCAVEKLVGCAPAPWSAGSAYAPGGHLLAPVAAVPVDVGSGHVHVVSVP